MIDLSSFGDNIFAAGDIHGQPQGLIGNIADCDIRDAAIVILGDIGLGFSGNMKGPIPYLHRMGKDRNNHFYLIRGNHDNPEAWTSYDKKIYSEKYPNVHLVQDFEELQLANEKLALAVPGAISIDRKWAVGKLVTEKDGSQVWKRFPRPVGKSYWTNEHIPYDLINDVEDKYDLVLAHTGPTPPSLRVSNSIDYITNTYDSELKQDLEKERAAVDMIISKSGCKKWINGHYHIDNNCTYAMNDTKFEYNGITVENVGIDYIIQIKL